MKGLDNFDKDFNFTVDTFDNVVPHFIDIEIHPDGLKYLLQRHKYREIHSL